MTDENDLFPFPMANSGELPEDKSAQDSLLPAFPSSGSEKTLAEQALFEPALTDVELREIRKMLADYKCSHPDAVSIQTKPPVAATIPVNPSAATPLTYNGELLQEKINKLWSQFSSADPVEIEAVNSFREIVKECPDDAQLLKILWCLAGIFPIKKNLRHGTPDQKLFALNALGDRFLQGISGIVLAGRKRLLKAVGKYFSDTTEGFSFISMENEPFNVQYHERVPGAASSGKTIREMHGFLVVAKDSNKVVRLGQVLT